MEEAWFAEEATGLNALVATAEATSTHPVAQAILNYVGDYQAVNLDQLEDVTGRGFTCAYQGHDWRIGKADFVLEVVGQVPANLEQVCAGAPTGLPLGSGRPQSCISILRER